MLAGGPSVEAFIQTLCNGILLGGIFGLLGLGLSLVFGTMRLLNFSQPAFIMVGMYVAYFLWFYLGLDPFIGSIAAFVVAFAIGYVLFNILIKRVIGHNELAQVFITVAILLCLDSLALILFGPATRSTQTFYQLQSISVLGVTLSLSSVFAFLIALLAAAGLHLLMKRTRFGQTIQASAQNSVAAELIGINVLRSYAMAFGLGVGLTAFAGAILLPNVTVFPTVGMNYAVIMFAVVVLGGLGSTNGAIVGGLIIGVVQQLSTLFWPTSVQNLPVFVVFLLMLTFRPYGILSKSQRAP